MKSLYKVIKSTRVDLEEEVCISGSSSDEMTHMELADEVNGEAGSRENSLENAIKYKLKLEKQARQTLADAKIQSEIMINEARKEAEAITKESKDEADNLRTSESQKGYNEGYDKGYNESIQKYNMLIEQANQIIDEAENYKKQSIESLEQEIIQVVLASVEKITRKILDENDDIILGIIKNAIETMTFRDYLIVTVSKEDFEIVEFAKNKILATYPGISKIEIKVADNFKKGDVEIESDSGSLNPSVSHQIKKLIGEFSKLIMSSDNIWLQT